jgi:hypothetical protein
MSDYFRDNDYKYGHGGRNRVVVALFLLFLISSKA